MKGLYLVQGKKQIKPTREQRIMAEFAELRHRVRIIEGLIRGLIQETPTPPAAA